MCRQGCPQNWRAEYLAPVKPSAPYRRLPNRWPTPILLVLQHRCSTHIIQRGPAFSRGADQRSWDSVVEGCREALGVVDPQVVGLSGGELLLDVGRLVGELLPAAGCGKDMVTVSLDDQDPYFAFPSLSLGQESPRCHRSSGRTAGLKYWGADLSPRSPVPTAGALTSFYDAAT